MQHSQFYDLKPKRYNLENRLQFSAAKDFDTVRQK